MTNKATSAIGAKAAESMDKVNNAVLSAVETTANAGNNLKERVAGDISNAADKLHRGADVAKDVLDEQADKVNETAHNAIGKINDLGHRAANSLERSSDYIKDFDVAEQHKYLRGKVGERPEISLAVAAVFGLAIGLLIGRKI